MLINYSFQILISVSLLILTTFQAENSNRNLSKNFENKSHLIRNRRLASQRKKIYVELHVVCDFYCFKKHQTIIGSSFNSNKVSKHVQAYYAMVISLTNTYYKNSFLNDTEMEFEMVIKNYTILTTEGSSSFTTSKRVFTKINNSYTDSNNRQYIDCDLAIVEFNEWLIGRIKSNSPLKFDIAIVFTFANIYSKQNDLLGLSIIGGACTLGISGILIEDDGSFSSSKTLAHEIAHR